MTDATFAVQIACHDIYDPVTDGVFDIVLRVNEDTVGIKRMRDAVWIVAAGTENLQGWLNDADILTEYIPSIGPVHLGFSQNVSGFMAKIWPLVNDKDIIKVTGHSRGAPIAALIATRLILSGMTVQAAYLFESPKFCYQRGADWFNKKVTTVLSTRCVAKWLPFLGDPVTAFPEPNLEQAWALPAPQKIIYGKPIGWRRFIPTEYHFGKIVIDAVNASQI